MPAPIEPLPDEDSDALGKVFEERAARHLRALLEAALFSSPEPVTASQFGTRLGGTGGGDPGAFGGTGG
jgi:hypothetical protein